MISKISPPVYTVNRSEPITSGFESFEVRNSLPYQKARYYERASERALEPPPFRPGEQPLVYSSKSARNPSNAVKRIDLYPVSAVPIKEKIYAHHCPTPPDRTGKEIDSFSQKSRANLRFTAINAREIIKSQFCMTYGDVWPINGRELKKDLKKFRLRLDRRFPNIHYLWIVEFQKRGAPHFHFFSDLAVTPENHDILTHAWYEIAGYGQDKHLRVHAYENNFIEWSMKKAGYLCKYLDKEDQKTIPQGFRKLGRFWGNSLNLVPKIQDEISKDEIRLFAVAEEKPWDYLVRSLCKYQEHINPRSNIRTTPQSRLILAGAPIAVRLRDYLFKPPERKIE